MARPPKSAKSPKSSRQVDALKHDAASRRNIPTAEMESFFRRDEDASPMPPETLSADPAAGGGRDATAEDRACPN